MPTADYCTRAWDLWGLNPKWFNLSICLWKHVWSFLQIHNKQKKSSRNFHCLALEKKRWNAYKTTILDGKLCPSLCQTWVEYCLLLDSSPLWSCCAVSPRQRSLAAQIWCSLEVSKDDDVETVQKEARILVLPPFSWHKLKRTMNLTSSWLQKFSRENLGGLFLLSINVQLQDWTGFPPFQSLHQLSLGSFLKLRDLPL